VKKWFPMVKNASLHTKDLPSKPSVVAFFDRCCNRHQLKKCCSIECNIVNHQGFPKAIFDTIHFIPDLVPGKDGHYKTLDPTAWLSDR